MEEYEIMDLTLRNAFLYLTTLGIITLSAYSKIKPIIKKYKIRKELNCTECQNDNSIIDWRNELIPFFFSIFLVYSFYPISFFTYMPFVPNHWTLDVLYSALIISSVSNVEYSGIKNLGNIFVNMIGRVTKRF